MPVPSYKSLLSGVALFAMIGTAHAEMRTTGTFGSWFTEAGINSNKKPMCSAYLQGTDRMFFLKYEYGTNLLLMQLYKTGWNIPVGTPVQVGLQVDNALAWYLNGVGIHAGLSGIELRVSTTATSDVTGKNALEDIESLLREGLTLKLFFPQGTEQPWIGSLSGSNAAIGTMANCMASMIPQARPQPTQPYSTAPARQPYSTQPFGRDL